LPIMKISGWESVIVESSLMVGVAGRGAAR